MITDRPKITWKVVKEFEEEGILVQVSASETARPRYTMRVGRRGENGVIPYLPVFTEGQGSVRVRSVVDTVGRLLDLAEIYVQGEAQKNEDAWIAARIEREEKGVVRDGKKRRPAYKQHQSR
mgnify:CR=1 FL=1